MIFAMWAHTMFASDRTSSTAPAGLRIFDSAAPGQTAVPEQSPGPRPGEVRAPLWPSKKQLIHLRRCDDEPALEYGCVDWFLYDKQRSQ